MRIALVLMLITLLAAGYPLPAMAETVPAAKGDTFRLRILHFVLRGIAPERARWMVDEAKKAGFNTIQVLVTDGVKLANAPWRPREDAWDREVFIEWSAYVRGQGMQIVPEIKLLSHQEKLFGDRHPELMFNERTYDPRNRDVYARVFPLLDEIIEICRPTAVHIGHDEVAGFSFTNKFGMRRKAWLKKGEKMLPADLFLEDVRRLHGHLKRQGVETWLWGDMLAAPEEFPLMLKNDLHGEESGYGRQLREKLPRDIVICDWHYASRGQEFPTSATFMAEGFRVIGATWEDEGSTKSFIRYAMDKKVYGMMATTWYRVQKKEWGTVERIIRFTGEAYRNAR